LLNALVQIADEMGETFYEIPEYHILLKLSALLDFSMVTRDGITASVSSVGACLLVP
jgi:hypothetical protein